MVMLVIRPSYKTREQAVGDLLTIDSIIALKSALKTKISVFESMICE